MALGLRSARPKLDTMHASEARAALAVAIAERNAVIAEAQSRADAVATAETRVNNARSALSAAEAGIEQAKQETIAALIAGDLAAHDGVTKARATAVAARDGLDVAEAVCKQLAAENAARAAALSNDPEWQQRKVREAALRVFAEHPDLAALLPRLQAAEAAYMRLAGAFKLMVEVGGIKIGRSITDDDETEDYRLAQSRVQHASGWSFYDDTASATPDGYIPSATQRGRRAVYGANVMLKYNQPLNAALDALMRDANAPLPGLAP